MFNSSLSVQLGWFSELKPSLCKFSEECEEYFSKSLFIVGEFGGNDYAFMRLGGKSLEQVHGYVPMVIKTISAATESLIKEGAKTIIIPGVWPDGCMPVNLAQNTSRPKEDYEPETGCLKDSNYLSRHHNAELLKAIKHLQHKYPHVRLIYASYYRPIIDFVRMPDRFGLIDTPPRTCCGNATNQYNLDQTKVCGMPGVGSCENPMEYVNWDGIHLTEAAYHRIAEGWLRGPYAEPPILSIGN
ncbi:GDSL esterase/lipase At5g45910-like [Carex rostrata]